MAFPTALTNAVDDSAPGVHDGTPIIAAILNNLEAKVGANASAVVTSLDYLLKSTSSIDPGHKHTLLELPTLYCGAPNSYCGMSTLYCGVQI